MSDWLACSPCCMAGSATLTMLTPTRDMKSAASRTTRTRHRAGSGRAGALFFPCAMTGIGPRVIGGWEEVTLLTGPPLLQESGGTCGLEQDLSPRAGPAVC